MAERAEFLREGFSWLGLSVRALWLLARGLWRPLALWALGASDCRRRHFLRPACPTPPDLALSAERSFLGLEGQGFAAAALERAGFGFVDVAAGADRAAAERSFFSRWLAERRPRRLVAAPEHADRARPMSSVCSRNREAEVSVAIVDYGSGNLHSAHKAFERAAREAGLDQRRSPSPRDPEVVAAADHIVLPGVGAFADCRRGLDARRRHGRGAGGGGARARPPVPRHLRRHAIDGDPRPRIRDHRRAWTGSPAMSRRSNRNDPALKIPHMGWNTLDARFGPHPLLGGHRDRARAGCTPISSIPFSLYAADRDDVIATADYGGPITAVVGRDNIVGTQFHPEKSQTLGLALDLQFSEMAPVIIFPAIDLKNGECVRLVRGDMAQATVFNSDPAAQARAFEAPGLRSSACRRSRRRIRRQADERAGRREDSARRSKMSGAARRRHPRHEDRVAAGSKRASPA